MNSRRKRGDETRERLLNWSEAQKASERLAGHILAAEGFKSIDPSHPLGGPDGLKDIVCVKDSIRWIAACYFPNGKQRFGDVKEKFEKDTQGVKSNNVKGFAFVTNQYLKEREREQLQAVSVANSTEIFHLERIASILDRPENYGVRLEFMDIEMSKEEQLAFFGVYASMMRDLENKVQSMLVILNEAGFSKNIPTNELLNFKQLLESIVGISGMTYTSYQFAPPIRKLHIPLDELREFENIINRLTGGPYYNPSYSPIKAPVDRLRIPDQNELIQYEWALDRILQKLKEINRFKPNL
jgi:hypothetical protein